MEKLSEKEETGEIKNILYDLFLKFLTGLARNSLVI